MYRVTDIMIKIGDVYNKASTNVYGVTDLGGWAHSYLPLPIACLLLTLYRVA